MAKPILVLHICHLQSVDISLCTRWYTCIIVTQDACGSIDIVSLNNAQSIILGLLKIPLISRYFANIWFFQKSIFGLELFEAGHRLSLTCSRVYSKFNHNRMIWMGMDWLNKNQNLQCELCFAVQFGSFDQQCILTCENTLYRSNSVPVKNYPTLNHGRFDLD